MHYSKDAMTAWQIKSQIGGNVEGKCVTNTCVRDAVDSWKVNIPMFVVIFLDLSLLYTSGMIQIKKNIFNVTLMDYTKEFLLTGLILFIYCIELLFRIYGYAKYRGSNLSNIVTGRVSVTGAQPASPIGHETKSCFLCDYIMGYLRRGLIEIFDLLFTMISISVTFIPLLYIINYNKYLIFSYEILRGLRCVFKILIKFKYARRCIRLLVSKNRQRYVDNKFDLDVSYILYPKILVMSWPSDGIEALYRNPLSEVARFLDEYHENNYLIFDLCSERHYDDSLFHGKVMRSRNMMDHSVCTISEMFEFSYNYIYM